MEAPLVKVVPMEIRAFHRRDRDQLTGLVNAHISSVVRGWVRHRGVATWLVRHAVARLRLGGTSRMLAPAAPGIPTPDLERFWARFGWYEIGRSRRGWRRRP